MKKVLLVLLALGLMLGTLVALFLGFFVARKVTVAPAPVMVETAAIQNSAAPWPQSEFPVAVASDTQRQQQINSLNRQLRDLNQQIASLNAQAEKTATWRSDLQAKQDQIRTAQQQLIELQRSQYALAQFPQNTYRSSHTVHKRLSLLIPILICFAIACIVLGRSRRQQRRGAPEPARAPYADELAGSMRGMTQRVENLEEILLAQRRRQMHPGSAPGSY